MNGEIIIYCGETQRGPGICQGAETVRQRRKDGYLESEDAVVTWCVGHLVTMSYPEVYDEKYKRWSLATLPFLPERIPL